MINDIDVCWFCGLRIGKSGSEHHLFNYYDFRDKMIETFPEKYFNKKTIAKLRFKWKKLKLIMPSYKIHKECHRILERKLAVNRIDRHKQFWKDVYAKESSSVKEKGK